MKPLTELTKKNKIFRWSEKTQVAFENIKAANCKQSLLLHPDPSKPFILIVDASPVGLGCVLGQEFNIKPNNDNPNNSNQISPIAYRSRTLIEAETRYTKQEREFLALVFAIEQTVFIFS